MGRSLLGSVLALLFLLPGASAQTVRVYVLAGQSNAVGFGADGALVDPLLDPQTDVQFRYVIGGPDAIDNPSLRVESAGLVDLGVQFDNGTGIFEGTTGFGPELMMGRMLADSRTDEVAIVKFAFGRSRLGDEWNVSTGTLYAELVGEVQATLTEITGQGKSPVLAGLFWMQGESDAREQAFAMAYEANLNQLLAAFRSDFSLPNLPVVIGQIHQSINLFGNYPFVNVVRSAQFAVADADPDTVLVQTGGKPLEDDFVHFSTEGQEELGECFAEAWVGLTGPVPMQLFDPVPGLARADNTYKSIGNTPFRKVFFVFGFDPGSVNVPLCPGLTLDIDRPINGGKVEADGVGVASRTIRIPNRIAGRTVLTQVVDTGQCDVTNVVSFTFPE